MLRKISVLVVLVLAVFAGSAQEFYNSVNPLTTGANSLNYKLTGRKYYFTSSLEGTVYVDNEWTAGSVILENGDRYDNVYLKLNTLTEDLICYNERTGSIIILDKYIIDEFLMDTGNSISPRFRKIYFDKYPKGEHYFNVLYDGKLQFLLWYQTHEVKTSVYRDSHGFLRDTEYKPAQDFFLVFPDNNIIKIKGTRKSLIDVFPDKKKEVRYLFRKNKIRIASKNMAELARAVNLIEEEFFSN